MARNKEFFDIISGVLGSFNSRNNDFQGYWAFGFLYKLSSHHNNLLEINLLTGEMTPYSKKLSLIAKRYQNFLLHLINIKKNSLNRIKEAFLTIHFNHYDEMSPTQELFFYYGDPYVISCKLIDHHGRLYSVQYYGQC